MHEHLPEFKLINMNGRVYDPLTAQFLSPDPYIQAPGYWLNYNRYAYCWNNPLIYIDETGEVIGWDDLIAALIGGLINWGTNGFQFTWEGLSYFGVGAAAGWAGLYTGGLASGAIMGAGNSVVGQGFAGGNGNTWNGNVYGWKVAGDAIMGAVTSYVGGQLSSKISPYVSKLTSNIPVGPVVEDMLTQSITSGTTGFTLGAGFTAINGGSFEESMQAGWNNAKVGLATGGVSGFASGMQRARAENVNWLTGKSNAKGNYSVYQGLDPNTNEVRYVGITERDPQIRYNEHLNSGTDRANLRYDDPIATGLTKKQARIMEQSLINKYGMQKNGGYLYNQRNSIAPKFWNIYGIK